MRYDALSQSIPTLPRSSSCPLSAGRLACWLGEEPPITTELPQPLLELLSSSMEPAHDGPDRDLHDVGDLLVGEPLDVGEQDGHAELLGQRLERLLHDLVRHALEHLGLGRAAGVGGLEPAEAVEERELLGVV